VLINGTHLSQAGVYEASMKAAHLAKAGGGKVGVRRRYRPVLWGLTARDMARTASWPTTRVTGNLQRVLPVCDLVVGTEEEIPHPGRLKPTTIAGASRAFVNARLR
jgi:5-dehydro-2-deoxygluconokinase